MSMSQLPLLESQLQFKLPRIKSVLSNYDPSAYPPDLQFARNHGKAQRVGQYIPPKQDIQRCPCCLQSIYKPQLPLSCDIRQILHIGDAYPLYLFFTKQCIYLLIINYLICSLPSTIINLTQGHMCVVLDGLVQSFYNAICQSSVINIMDVQQIDMLQVQSCLNFTCIVISTIIIAILDIMMTRQYNTYYAQYHILPKSSDYSVILQGLPKDITISQINQFILQKIRDHGITTGFVHKIYLIYNLKTYYSLYANKRSMLQQITVLQKQYVSIQQKLDKLDGNQPLAQRTKLTRQKKQTIQKIGELENKKELVEIQINNFQEMFKMVMNKITNQQPIGISAVQNQPNLINLNQENKTSSTNTTETINKLHLSFSGKCIVTLNTFQSKQVLTAETRNLYFLQKVAFHLGQCLGGSSSPIIIQDAPEPTQIIFANIGSQKSKRWRDNILITLALIMLILLDFFLLTIQKKLIKQQKAVDSSNIILSVINSQIIALFNSIVSRIIRRSQNSTQMHSTQSSYYYSVTSKLVYLYLINMLVTTFFSNLVNYYLINEQKRIYDNRFPLNLQQFLFDIFFLLITNPFVSFFLIFFDHRQGYKLFKRYQIEHMNLPVTQAQANLYYQNMQIDLSNKYGNIYRFVLFSAGVCAIYPPAIFICILTLIVFYWQDKYLLLRRYAIPHKLNFNLTDKFQKILWMYPMMMAITNLIIMFIPIYDGKVFQQGKYSKAYYYLSIFALIASVVIYLGGCNWITAGINKLFFKKSKKTRQMPQYKDIEMDFEDDYWHYYPYFKIKKIDQKERKDSPRKQRIDQMNKKLGMDVFSVIKNHLHHDRYSPIV